MPVALWIMMFEFYACAEGLKSGAGGFERERNTLDDCMRYT